MATQFFNELDNLSDLSQVIVLGATNREDLLDPALTRAGRLDYVLRFPIPDEKDRLEILKVHTKDRPLGADVDLNELASLTKDMVASQITSPMPERSDAEQLLKSSKTPRDYRRQTWSFGRTISKKQLEAFTSEGGHRNMLKEVRKKRAYEDIVAQIRTLIEKGRLKQGDQLPNEKELSDTFKVSRSTVREAILSLETLKLLDRRQGNGTYVIATSEEAIIKPLAASFFHEQDSVIDIFTVRKILEPEIAELAARHATQKAIHHLEEIVNNQERDLAGGKNPVRTDSDFHYALAGMSKNKVLERLLLLL